VALQGSDTGYFKLYNFLKNNTFIFVRFKL